MAKTGKEDPDNQTGSVMKFETAMGRLEEVVARMESGELDLDSVIAQYEEGMHLARFCHQKLEQVQKKVEKLNRENQSFRLEVLGAEGNDDEDEEAQETGVP